MEQRGPAKQDPSLIGPHLVLCLHDMSSLPADCEQGGVDVAASRAHIVDPSCSDMV